MGVGDQARYCEGAGVFQLGLSPLSRNHCNSQPNLAQDKTLPLTHWEESEVPWVAGSMLTLRMRVCVCVSVSVSVCICLSVSVCLCIFRTTHNQLSSPNRNVLVRTSPSLLTFATHLLPDPTQEGHLSERSHYSSRWLPHLLLCKNIPPSSLFVTGKHGCLSLFSVVVSKYSVLDNYKAKRLI